MEAATEITGSLRKPIVVRLTDSPDNIDRARGTVLWRVWRDGDYWFLRDHDNRQRTLERTWALSVPRIKTIAENYGLTLLQELS